MKKASSAVLAIFSSFMISAAFAQPEAAGEKLNCAKLTDEAAKAKCIEAKKKTASAPTSNAVGCTKAATPEAKKECEAAKANAGKGKPAN
jgi:hypothetical protein